MTMPIPLPPLSLLALGLLPFVLCACGTSPSRPSGRTFGEDVRFLKQHRETIVLASADGQAKLAVVPGICGRVFTSTASGDEGEGFGFLNDERIASKAIAPKINSYGGEDRFWMGPEGGQFAIFFKPGSEFTTRDWQTPAPIDTEPYQVVTSSPTSIRMTHDAEFENFTGTRFQVRIDRTVTLCTRGDTCATLGIDPEKTSIRCVAFETFNTIFNIGKKPWTPDSGLLSIWTLGMFKPSARTTVVVPLDEGSSEHHPIVTDDYFGKVPATRLRTTDRAAFFRADGMLRTKIGVSPRFATERVGSWDPTRGVLTIVEFSKPPNRGPAAPLPPYVNSLWKHQDNPFSGDTINSYNDDATAQAKPSFYELETSSPALSLRPSESGTHRSTTIHCTGPRAELDAIARRLLQASLREIEGALP